MDARSIAATAANKGYLTAATDVDVEFTNPTYHFDKTIYENRVFDSKGVADPSVEIKFGPNIKDWPEQVALTDNILIKVVSEIHDPVTTTDELIPSGETSSYRSNPLGLAEFTLSRKDPAYVGLAKEMRAAEEVRRSGACPMESNEEVKRAFTVVKEAYPQLKVSETEIGSTIFAVKPGDGSAREQGAAVSLDNKVPFTLKDKVINGKLYVEQGIIAGCAGGGFENICAAADILKGKSIGSDEFTLSVYPASTPIYAELARNGRLADLMTTGTVVKTAFCGPCFGAGDTPANNAFSIRHSTRNFPNREGSKLQNGQIASVALMDARSIAATAANKGYLTAATDVDVEFTNPTYHFDKTIYENRVFDSKGVADPSVEIKFGPNIKDWPEQVALTDNILIKVVSEIHDPVTTTDPSFNA
jgi:aconitase A